jgi:anti-sigma regulatory factor (Ser/Thr protein kinase)
MSKQTTPLGFLAGDIDLHSHCMYVYTKRDEIFTRNVAEFLAAGLRVGELCVAVLGASARKKVRDQLGEPGLEPAPESETAQLVLCDPTDVYTRNGMLDTDKIADFWRRQLDLARGRWNGVRAFGDPGLVPWNRIERLKFLEYEALVNLACPMTIVMCGYQAGATARSWLLQARSVHPFIANSRSIRRNPTYVETPRFLSGLYKFRRVSREYPAIPGQEEAAHRDVEEVAARTPLSMTEIGELKLVVGALLSHMVQHGRPASGGSQPHFHVTFTAEADQFLVTIRSHYLHFRDGCQEVPDIRRHVEASWHATDKLIDELKVESWRGEAAVTLAKRYRSRQDLGL